LHLPMRDLTHQLSLSTRLLPHLSPDLFPYTTLFRSLSIKLYIAMPIIISATPSILNGPGTGNPSNIISPIIAKTTSKDCVASTRSEEHTSELQSRFDLVCRLLLEKIKTQTDASELDR